MIPFFMHYRFLFILPLFWLGSGLQAQNFIMTPVLKAAMQALLELRYPALDSLLASEDALRPENRAVDYLKAASLAIEVFLNEDENDFTRRRPELLALLTRLESLDPNHPYSGLSTGEIYLARAGLQAKFGNLVKAAWYFNKAHGILKENYRRHPDFLPNLIAWGALQVALGSLPDGYQGIASLLGYQGDRELGLRLIRTAYYRSEALAEWQHYRSYAAFVYVFLNYQLQTDEQVRLSELGFEVARNPIFIYLEAYQLFEVGKAPTALALLRKRSQGSAYLDFPYLDYFTAKVAVADAPELAASYFQRYLRSLPTGRHNYRASSMRYQAWLDLAQGQKASAEAKRQAIIDLGHYPRSADRQALAEAQRGFNPLLILARRYTDAGHFEDMLTLLSAQALPACCPEAWERQEYFYRKGRAEEALGRKEKAILNYRLALAENYSNPTYARGNSALRAGQLLQSLNRHQEARELLQMALKLKGYPFYEGIQQRAQTALEAS